MAEEKSTEPTISEQKIDEQRAEQAEKTKGKKGKKKNPFVKFLKALFFTVFGIIFIIAGYLGVNAFMREDITKAVPPNYSIHLRTDSVWKSVEPLIDLEATDILLADSSLIQFRDTVLEFRKSSLRNNKLLHFALSLRVDAMLYENDFLCVVDTGWLSGVVKLAPVAVNFIKIENLSYIKNADSSYFEYKAGDTTFYVKIHKNLLIATSSKELFNKSVSLRNGDGYNDAKIKSFKEKLLKPFSVTADGRELLGFFSENNEYAEVIRMAFPEDDLATVDFGVTDKKINLNIRVPFALDGMDSENPMIKILKRESAIPAIVPKLPEQVQYYTIISAGSLEEMKNAIFSVAADKNDLESTWKLGQNLSNVVFHESLENLLFSWTGNEYAVLGLENRADPVFVIKVSDEEQRKYIFEKIFDSIILKNDTSLLIDNVRLPRIQFPQFIQSVLGIFGISLPSPYYMVKDGYAYFSQSAENLASLNASIKNGSRLAKNDMWKDVSEEIAQYSSLSLYYNLERSIPFFIQKNSMISKVLKLYNVGRADFQIKNNEFIIQLNGIVCADTSSSSIHGFPIEISKNANYEILKTNKKNGKTVYWCENDFVKSLDASTLSVIERRFENLKYVIPASGETKKGDLWCVTSEGTAYFVDEKLADVSAPRITGEIPASNLAVYKDGIIYAAKGQKLVFVSNADVVSYDIDSFDDISSTPVIVNDKAILYEKSFLGGLHVIDLASKGSEEIFVEISEIGFGSPAVVKTKSNQYTGFVSQAGSFYMWDKDFVLVDGFPLEMNGTFYSNVISSGDSFICFAVDGTLNKITIEGIVTKVVVPNLTAKKCYLTANDYNDDGADEIFVCGDGNSIYGFTNSLELLDRFPLQGYGIPAFVDLNGNKKNDCLTLSLDNKLNGWKVF